VQMKDLIRSFLNLFYLYSLFIHGDGDV